jgi:hypothetical protein
VLFCPSTSSGLIVIAKVRNQIQIQGQKKFKRKERKVFRKVRKKTFLIYDPKIKHKIN